MRLRQPPFTPTSLVEHGDTELPVLSSSTVAGVSMRKTLEKNPGLEEELEKVFEQTRDAAYNII